MESSLFGHSRGAFTGAIDRKAGFAEAASGGTLFLDEIGELDFAAQARLLRFLDSGMYTPVGETDSKHSTARIVSATNRDLRAEISKGTFREDLFYRLSSVAVRIPPLRERVVDILPLARHFATAVSDLYGLRTVELSSEAKEVLNAYSWPGNVRHLRNEILSVAIRRAGRLIIPTDLSAELLAGADEAGGAPQTLDSKLMRYEKSEMLEALRMTGSNCSRAAELLGLKRTTFLYRMKRHGIILREKKG
jgi:DNA-binding NtrC family response regulator